MFLTSIKTKQIKKTSDFLTDIQAWDLISYSKVYLKILKKNNNNCLTIIDYMIDLTFIPKNPIFIIITLNKYIYFLDLINQKQANEYQFYMLPIRITWKLLKKPCLSIIYIVTG